MSTLKIKQVMPRVDCEAVQVTGNYKKIAEWCEGLAVYRSSGKFWHIDVCDGDANQWGAYQDYWIVKRNGCVIDVCSPERFVSAWQEVKDVESVSQGS